MYRIRIAVLILVSVALVGCSSSGSSGPTDPTDPPAPTPPPSFACRITLSEQLEFATASEGSEILRRPDDWSLQLSAFERSARRRTLEPVSMEELLAYVSTQTLDWTPDEQAYWQGVVDQLSAALEGLDIEMPEVRLVKTTGLEDFDAAYARHDAIVLPQRMVSGSDRRGLGLLAHELFHVLSWDDPSFRSAAYALLGFKQVPGGFEPPAELEDRRLSNPAGHTYNHALTVERPDGRTADVVPFLRSKASLEVLLGFSLPSAIVAFLEVLLLPVDPQTGELVRGEGGELITYDFDDTTWVQQMQRNTDYIIHPEETMAVNFSILVRWRATGVAPSGPGINDLPLLRALEDLLACEG